MLLARCPGTGSWAAGGDRSREAALPIGPVSRLGNPGRAGRAANGNAKGHRDDDGGNDDALVEDTGVEDTGFVRLPRPVKAGEATATHPPRIVR
ncbi:MAG: hypothetical protein V3S64_13675 [bacterium]